MREEPNLKAVSDDELLRRLCELAGQSRRVEADVIAHIGEVEARRAYARQAVSSMCAYCIEVLHYSEPEAVLRIRVARASRQHPTLLSMLRDGQLHLSGIALLAPLLTPQNREVLLRRAMHSSKRQIRELVAELEPRPDVPSSVRKLRECREAKAPAKVPPLCPDTVDESSTCPRRDPVGAASGSTAKPEPSPPVAPPRSRRAATVEPLAAARYRVAFTAGAELRDKLERLQDLMRASVPDGDLAAIIDAAVTEKLERLEAKRFATTKRPRNSLADADTTPKSRHIPAAVRRAVHDRDGGRCTYRNGGGKRCTKRHDLEFHHRTPFGRGGEHSPAVLTLHCKAHNALMAELDFGKEVVHRYRRSVSRVSEPLVAWPGSVSFRRPRPT